MEIVNFTISFILAMLSASGGADFVEGGMTNTCINQCSIDSCSGFFYNSCNNFSGCMVKGEREIIIGKCEVQCLKDGDCNRGEWCESYKCEKIPDKYDPVEIGNRIELALFSLESLRLKIKNIEDERERREMEEEWDKIKATLYVQGDPISIST